MVLIIYLIELLLKKFKAFIFVFGDYVNQNK